jgi:hypothetical protein
MREGISHGRNKMLMMRACAQIHNNPHWIPASARGWEAIGMHITSVHVTRRRRRRRKHLLIFCRQLSADFIEYRINCKNIYPLTSFCFKNYIKSPFPVSLILFSIDNF